jgi:predicted ATPase
MALTNDPRLQEIRSLLGRDGLGVVDNLDIQTFKEPKSQQKKEGPIELYRVWFQPSLEASASSRDFDFADLSSGTQRVIRILVSLIFDESAVMLLEHPEDGIHRGLLRKLIDLLQKYADPSQLIVSSHSPLVFNTLDPRAVRLVTMEEGATKVRRLTPEELQVAGKFLEEDGSLADFLETVEED